MLLKPESRATRENFAWTLMLARQYNGSLNQFKMINSSIQFNADEISLIRCLLAEVECLLHLSQSSQAKELLYNILAATWNRKQAHKGDIQVAEGKETGDRNGTFQAICAICLQFLKTRATLLEQNGIKIDSMTIESFNSENHADIDKGISNERKPYLQQERDVITVEESYPSPLPRLMRRRSSSIPLSTSTPSFMEGSITRDAETMDISALAETYSITESKSSQTNMDKRLHIITLPRELNAKRLPNHADIVHDLLSSPLSTVSKSSVVNLTSAFEICQEAFSMAASKVNGRGQVNQELTRTMTQDCGIENRCNSNLRRGIVTGSDHRIKSSIPSNPVDDAIATVLHNDQTAVRAPRKLLPSLSIPSGVAENARIEHPIPIVSLRDIQREHCDESPSLQQENQQPQLGTKNWNWCELDSAVPIPFVKESHSLTHEMQPPLRERREMERMVSRFGGDPSKSFRDFQACDRQGGHSSEDEVVLNRVNDESSVDGNSNSQDEQAELQARKYQASSVSIASVTSSMRSGSLRRDYSNGEKFAVQQYTQELRDSRPKSQQVVIRESMTLQDKAYTSDCSRISNVFTLREQAEHFRFGEDSKRTAVYCSTENQGLSSTTLGRRRSFDTVSEFSTGAVSEDSMLVGGEVTSYEEVTASGLPSPTMESITTFYDYTQLIAPGPYPTGICVRKREIYLSNADFLQILGVTKREWPFLPKWKQVRRKRESGLF